MTEIDYEAVAEYLTLGYTLDLKTFLKGKKFIPKYIRIPDLKIYFDATIADLKHALENYFLDFDGKKVAVMLSGGKDSRVIIEMCNNLGIDTTAITFGYKEDSRENIIAKRVSSVLNIPHIFLPLKKDMFSIDTIKERILCSKNDPTAAPRTHHFCYKDILSEYDAVFTGEHLTYSLREDRYYQPNNIIDRLLRTITFDDIVIMDKREKIKNKIISDSIGKSLNELALKKITDSRFKVHDMTTSLFNYECIALDKKLNVLWSIPERENMKQIMKSYNFKTRSLSCTRSPFPLSYPWLIHYSYMKIKRLHVGLWCNYYNVYSAIIKKIAINLGIPDSLDFDFIEQEIIRQKLSYADKNFDAAKTILRLIKLKLWLEAIN